MTTREPIITRAGMGIEHGHAGGAGSVTALAAAQNPGGVAVQFARMPVGSGAPFHRHPSFDEVFIILEGAVEFQADRTVHTLRKGDLIWIPGETPHAPKAVEAGPSGFAELVMLVTPARFEDFFHEMGAIIGDPDFKAKLAPIAERYGIEFLDRPTPEPASPDG